MHFNMQARDNFRITCFRVWVDYMLTQPSKFNSGINLPTHTRTRHSPHTDTRTRAQVNELIFVVYCGYAKRQAPVLEMYFLFLRTVTKSCYCPK